MILMNSLSHESSDRESYEPSLASDQQTLTSSDLQDTCDQPPDSERLFFDRFRSTGSSIDAGFGPPVRYPVEGGEALSQAHRTLSAGGTGRPEARVPGGRRALSFPALGSSAPSFAQVQSPFGQGNSPKKPSW